MLKKSYFVNIFVETWLALHFGQKCLMLFVWKWACTIF